ncbi:3D (Asp-Asp-Asp) domain-containing protein [Tumebacillus sp. BK434]|uniref:S-layer homology domain-containing protein n=1 Tax=Tumebacillus sp. BK434 TaxID=2512169 RepID=UPI0010D726A7|nr:S-layer homology domain-containing protein [Tumebacillus sp. BK434]TCP54637.1 3D (Asp-Asp-Asp) domain-containing protein [Tumebacillus sp. BK434]
MKKIIKALPLLALAAIAFLALPQTSEAANGNPFSDIDNSYAKNEILSMYSNHIIQGFTDGTFRPKQQVTRAEFAAMLINAKKLPLTDPYKGVFRDVPRGEWYTTYAELSYRLGVTSGTADGVFQPNKPLSREEMIKMTVSALGKESETARKMSYTAYSRAVAGYSDRGSISSWAVKAVAYATDAGLIHGSGGKVEAKRYATREEVATFLYHSIVQRPKPGNVFNISSRGGMGLNYHTKKATEATAYTYSGNPAYTGIMPRVGMVAVDPAQIALGSHLYIPGYGYGIAGDTGGAIKNLRVDLFHPDYYSATLFGRKAMDVYILD